MQTTTTTAMEDKGLDEMTKCKDTGNGCIDDPFSGDFLWKDKDSSSFSAYGNYYNSCRLDCPAMVIGRIYTWTIKIDI